ncbi:alpha/beta fold hydrolase [Salinimonas iocasae]|uniref:Alpha/beta hydrolase n=1 Tax=Salinimonas iocasae TaxID=2572577 RepID=A0A5B7YG00_9ALTE|nr:alpha/beta hydrolase [Salinimonas iocasae]QCZ94682.1 alpha/beta hydrolase [Salinimonas iocasae]
MKTCFALILLLTSFCTVAASTIELEDGFVEYEIKGNGDIPVLFDAGAVSGMAGWDAIWQDLPEGITALRFSRQGEGNSDSCEGQRSAADYVDEVAQLLSALQIKTPIVYVSHSFGGITARNFAAAHTSEIAALLMVDPANPRDVEIVTQLNPEDGHLEVSNVKENDYKMGAGTWCFLDVVWDKSDSVGYAEIGDIPVTLIAGTRAETSPSHTLETQRGRALWGKYQSEWVNQFPRGKAVLAPHSGHMVQDDQPALVLNELVKLLNRLENVN